MNYLTKIILVVCFSFFGCSNPSDEAIIAHITKYCTLKLNKFMESGCKCIAKEVLQSLSQKEKDNFAQANESKKKALGRIWFEQNAVSQSVKLLCLSKQIK